MNKNKNVHAKSATDRVNSATTQWFNMRDRRVRRSRRDAVILRLSPSDRAHGLAIIRAAKAKGGRNAA